LRFAIFSMFVNTPAMKRAGSLCLRINPVHPRSKVAERMPGYLFQHFFQ
jgi:hypothetical protein